MDHQFRNGRTFRAWRVVYALCLIGLFFAGFNAKLAFAQATRAPSLAWSQTLQAQ